MRTQNPVLNERSFPAIGSIGGFTQSMSIQGVVNKTAVLLLTVLFSASFTWNLHAATGNLSSVKLWIATGAIGGLIVAFITIWRQSWSPVTAPVYAVLEGLALGGISAVAEAATPGIALQAVLLTFGTLGGLLLAYQSGLIQATGNFKLGVVAATGGIALVYLLDLGFAFFGLQVPFIHETGVIGIGISLFVVGVAALNLVLDFDFIENGAASGAPKYMEWYAAFGLMVTLIWLYVEILRLLAKLRSDD